MSGRQAKVLLDQQIEDLLVYTSTTRNPERNRVVVLLSIKAGLRAGEIAKLTTWCRCDLRSRHSDRAPGSRRQKEPCPPDPAPCRLADRPVNLAQSKRGGGAVIRSERGDCAPLSIVNWFAGAFCAIGLEGCSSHSGRRTFITRAVRVVHQAEASLPDVQLLAGHRSIQMIRHAQRY
jgi:integrase